MSVVSRGYQVLAQGDIAIDEWSTSILGDSAEEAEPSELKDWNYYQSVRVRTILRLDPTSVSSKLELTSPDQLRAAIVWSSSGTGLRGRSDFAALEEAEMPLELVLESGQLRQQLQLEVLVALGRQAPSGALSPKAPGSVVWASSRYAIDLEGLGSRLPVVAFPFSKRLQASAGAQWWLQVQSKDLEQPVDSVLWMWLNDEHPYVNQLLREPEDEASQRTSLHLVSDFHRQLLQLALAHEDLAMDANYAPGSLGEALVSVVRLIDPDLEALRSTYRVDPWKIETVLQAALGGVR